MSTSDTRELLDSDDQGLPIFQPRDRSSASKRQTIARMALREFHRHGFSGASVDAIAEAAKVSKPTIYRHFDNKERLFLGVVAEALSAAYQELPVLAGSLPFRQVSEHQEMSALLERFLAAAAEAVLGEEIISLRRLVIGEAERFPQLAALWASINDEMINEPLMEAFWTLEQRGLLAIPDRSLAAQQLIALTIGAPQLVVTFHTETSTARAAERYLSSGILLFLSYYTKELR
ncbi:TetR/AcrR family transcriptional regulator [Psychromicrobium lacuslunae]|uniref:HTH tetR-type domain-containing protein n=1 Tax=Psychromicrobium lacuslunae TaxID=1618207 RepID=A0A0D4BXA2_9MICC|nr:TetR/AcrR family transcriptional regulator [Psychromicrobium lacuslunae]AJT41062.1 hypothetical protein UM93_05175 [Psychromicrobium lacuslunae]